MTRAEELLKYGSYFDQAEVVASFLNDGGWPTYAAIVRRLGRAAQGTEAQRAETSSGSVHDGPVRDSECAQTKGQSHVR